MKNELAWRVSQLWIDLLTMHILQGCLPNCQIPLVFFYTSNWTIARPNQFFPFCFCMDIAQRGVSVRVGLRPLACRSRESSDLLSEVQENF